MKNKSNGKYFKFGITIFLALSGSILFFYLLFFGADLKNTIIKFISIFSSIIFGIGLAYILNPLCMFFEKNIMKKIFKKILKKESSKKNEFKLSRGFSIFLTMITFGVILYGLIILIVPQVIESIQNIILRIPQYLSNANVWANNFIEKYPEFDELSDDVWINIEDWFTSYLVPGLQSFISRVSSSLVGSVVSIFNGLLNFIIGIIVSIYLLHNKEIFCAQAKKVSYALLREERANTLINNMRYGNKIFGGFLSGKILDSIIIGIICYICMLILKMPYSALISVVVGVTNIIPYFGPFIGAIPCAIIIFLINPMKCLTFIIFILILQQFDGNILGPKILGESTGLNSFWVIFSITLFSGFFGVLGMFIGVPVFAVIYAAIKTFVNERLEKKNLPVSTEYYKNYDFHSNNTDNINTGKEFRFIKKTFENVYPENRNDDMINQNENNVVIEEKPVSDEIDSIDKQETYSLDKQESNSKNNV